MRNLAKNPQYIALCIAFFLLVGMMGCKQQAPEEQDQTERSIVDSVSETGRAVSTGPEQLIQESLGMLQGKRVGLVANHTSLVFAGTHLVDTLVGSGVNLVRVFAPEHGFRGQADAGQKVKSGVDEQTGLPIISLYGKRRKPLPEDLDGLDLVIFDIQDIGSRHYTYISTMSNVMEACAEQGIPFWVLDRPNPNGWYVDGPMMEAGNESFIGMHKIPIVHGMTIAEYAVMVNEEGWLKGGVKAQLEIIPCVGYKHEMRWEETGLSWTAPSPNIATEYAAYLYPALCWLEPTPASVGRGTDSAFTLAGAPWFEGGTTARTEAATLSSFGLELKALSFRPRSLPGKSTYPKFEDELCYGFTFTNRVGGKELFLAGIQLFSDFYQQHKAAAPNKSFFRKGFNKWPGNTNFQSQIEAGMSPEDIYNSWQQRTNSFRSLRSKYLLYQES